MATSRRAGAALAESMASWLPASGLGVAALAAWEGAVRIFDVPRWLLPPPSSIVREVFAAGDLLARHAWTTLQEILVGFAVAAGLGVALAVLIAYSRTLERSLYPYVIASQTIPIIAIAPLLLVWVGPGQASKVIIVALISFFPIVVNVVDGLRSADSEMIAMFRTLGASRGQIFRKLQAPSALPFFLSGLKVAAVVAVIGAVIGEWVGASGGLGWLMRVSAPQFHTARVFAAIFILSGIGICLFLLVGAVERFALRHYSGSRR